MASSAMTDASVPPAGEGRLEAEAMQEFLFEEDREADAKTWLPNLAGEMDPPQTGPYPQRTSP